MSEAADVLRRKKWRDYQKKCRGDKESPKTDYLKCLLILAWEAGDLTEGQVCVALDMERVALRELRDEMIQRGAQIGSDLHREMKAGKK